MKKYLVKLIIIFLFGCASLQEQPPNQETQETQETQFTRLRPIKISIKEGNFTVSKKIAINDFYDTKLDTFCTIQTIKGIERCLPHIYNAANIRIFSNDKCTQVETRLAIWSYCEDLKPAYVSKLISPNINKCTGTYEYKYFRVKSYLKYPAYTMTSGACSEDGNVYVVSSFEEIFESDFALVKKELEIY